VPGRDLPVVVVAEVDLRYVVLRYALRLRTERANASV
jgi:hypothetical protein